MNKLSNEANEQNDIEDEEESHEIEDDNEEAEEDETEEDNNYDRDESEIQIERNKNCNVEYEQNEFIFEIPDSIENDPKKLIDLLKNELVMAKSQTHSFEQKYLQVNFQLKDTQSQLKHAQTDKEDLLKELNNLIASKLKLQNEVKRYKVDYEAIHKEYTQIMSERDLVHKEIEALQEQLCKEKDKIKSLTSNCTEIDVLKRELSSAINDRDLALNEVIILKLFFFFKN
jgi:chromosome segregation ATPase